MKANWSLATPVEPPAAIPELVELDMPRPFGFQDLRESVEFLDVIGAAPEAVSDPEKPQPTAV